jgi:uncharacterized membrane protein YkvA (DUF1232 family)
MDLQSASLGLLIVLAVVLIAILGVAVVLLVRLVKMFQLVRSEDMPTSGKVTFWAALIYTLFPVDVLPDPIYLDDIGVLTAALGYLTHLISKYGVTRRDPAPVEIDKAPRPSRASRAS